MTIAVVATARPECVILVGLPGAGKTTFCRARYPSHEHISKDAWPNAGNKQARQDAALRLALAAGRSVVVDNTNVSPAERASVIAIARELGARIVGYYVEAAHPRGGGEKRAAHRPREGAEGGDLHRGQAAGAARGR